MINTGGKSVQEVSEIIKQTDSLDTDPFVNQSLNKNNADLPTQVRDTIINLEVNKAAYIKFNGVHFLFVKQDNSAVPFDISNQEEKNQILYDMNSAKFEKLIDDTMSNLQFTINEPVINGVDISIFAQ